jgi:metal-dependent amidase/aminoacylase/carboxypeptidase family protein
VTFSAYTSTMRNNPVLVERFRENMADHGRPDQGPDEFSGSTDMANVSWVCPAIQPELAIAPPGTPKHSLRFRDAAASAEADATVLLAATLLAETALELYLKPGLLDAAWSAFREGR